MTEPQAPKNGPLVIAFLGGAVGLLVFAALNLLASIDPAAYLRGRADQLAQQLSERLGRQVSIGDIERLELPTLGARLKDVRVAGPREEGPDQVNAESVDVTFSLLGALASLGQALDVETVAINGMQVRAARDKSGRWDVAGMLEKLREGPGGTQSGAEAQALDLAFLEGHPIEELSLNRGRIRLEDDVLGRPLAVEDIQITLRDIALDKPMRAQISGVLVDGNTRTPVRLAGKLGRLPRDLAFRPMPPVEAELTSGPLPVAPWGGLLPRESLAPAEGTVELALRARAGEDLKPLQALGRMRAKGLQLRQGESVGRPIDADVDLDVSLDPDASRYDLNRLSWQGGGVNMKGGVKATGLSPAAIERADLDVEVADLQRVLDVVPATARPLPEALRVSGPLRAHVRGDADTVDLEVDLDGARVAWGDVFDKKPGRPLRAKLEGTREAQGLRVPRFSMKADEAELRGTLELPTDPDAPIEAALDSERIPLTSLRELLPPVRQALQRGDRVEGAMQARIDSTLQGDRREVHASLTLRDVDAQVGATHAKGDATVEIDARRERGQGTQSWKADFTPLALQSADEDGRPVLDKGAGTPLRVEAQLATTPKRASIERVEVAVGESTLRGTGEATGLDGDESRFAIDFGTASVFFPDLRRALPGASSLPEQGRLAAALRLSGETDAPSTWQLEARDLGLDFGASSARGSATLQNPLAPRLSLNLPKLTLRWVDVAPLLDKPALAAQGGGLRGAATFRGETGDADTWVYAFELEELTLGDDAVSGSIQLERKPAPVFVVDLEGKRLTIDRWIDALGVGEAPVFPLTAGLAPVLAAAAAEPGLPSNLRSFFRDAAGQARIRADQARFGGAVLAPLEAEFTLGEGGARFDKLSLGFAGGTVQGAGSTLGLAEEEAPFELALQFSDLDLQKLVEPLGEDDDPPLTGRVSGELEARGAGLAAPEAARSATGRMDTRFASLSLAHLDLVGAIFDKLRRAARKDRKLKLDKPAATGSTGLDALEGRWTFRRGRLELENPVVASAPFGSVTLEGGASLDGKLDMSATVALSPATLAAWTQGRVQPERDVPVPVTLRGTWDAPSIGGINVGALVTALLDDKNRGAAAIEGSSARARKRSRRAGSSPD